MSTLLKRLFGRGRDPEGDLATGDWTPVPASAVARPEDLVSWLADEPIRTAVAASTTMFSPDELAIIDEQRRAQAPVLASEIAPAELSPPPRPDPQPEPAPAPQASWIEVLRAYAEHLTDAELHILREQLQG